MDKTGMVSLLANRQLSEGEIAALALGAGMTPDEVIELLESIGRWRNLGIGKPS